MSEVAYSSGISDVPLLGDTIGANLDRKAVQFPGQDALVECSTGINPSYRTHELEYVLNQAAVRMLVSAPRFKTSDYVSIIEQVNPETGLPMQRGEPGELCTRGYSVMLGYWEQPEKTAEVIDAARWMHTGDLAVMDESGGGEHCRGRGQATLRRFPGNRAAPECAGGVGAAEALRSPSRCWLLETVSKGAEQLVQSCPGGRTALVRVGLLDQPAKAGLQAGLCRFEPGRVAASAHIRSRRCPVVVGALAIPSLIA